MKTIGVSKFKSHALRILDQVAKTHEIVLITKRGKPLAQVTSYRPSDRYPKSGKLADTLLFEKEIVSPLGEEIWEVCR